MTMFKKCRGIHREKGLAGKWPEPTGSDHSVPVHREKGLVRKWPEPTGSGHFRAKPFFL
jgi:hypothetical protein